MSHSPRAFGRLTGTLALLLGTSHAFAADPDLLVFDYSGFENPAFHAPFTATHGASPTFAFFGDEEEAFQKIISGFKSDVTHICAGSVNKWVAAGIVEPWDTAKIKQFDALDSNLLGEDVTADAELYFIPTDYGTTAVAYNPDKVTADDVNSLDVFLDPKYAGRTSMPNNVDDIYALAFLATGVTDWTTATDAQFEAATDWLRKAHANVRTYWNDAAELSQLMATGEVLISWAWNEVYPAMQEENLPIAYERAPSEGSSVWLCGYVNMADGPGSEDQAYDYLNALLDESSSRPLLEYGFATSNRDALGQISDEELTSSGLGPVDAPLLAQLPLDQEMRTKQSTAFERIKAGF